MIGVYLEQTLSFDYAVVERYCGRRRSYVRLFRRRVEPHHYLSVICSAIAVSLIKSRGDG